MTAEHAGIKLSRETVFSKTLFYILFTYFSCIMLIETANGLFIFKNIAVLSNLIAAGKLGISLLSLCFIAMYSRNLFLRVLLLIGLASLTIFTHQISAIDDDLRSINIIFKIFNNFFGIYFILFLIRLGDFGKSKIRTIILLNYAFLLLNIYLGALGIGFANYTSADDTAIGGTGFLYAGNEVGVSLLLGFAAMLLSYAKNLKIVSLIILSTIIAGLLVLSKATIIGVLLSTIVFLFYINKTATLVFVSTTVFLLISTLPLWINYFQLAINRWTYLLNSYGVEAFLLGGHKRVTYINSYLNFILNEPMYIFTGVGWIGEAENNFFDMIEAFGILGLIVFLGWCFSLAAGARHFSVTFKYSAANAAFKTIAFIGLLVLFISIIAGHSIQSSLIAPFIGTVCLVHYLFGIKKIGINK